MTDTNEGIVPDPLGDLRAMNADLRKDVLEAEARIRELERELHGASNRAEMACQAEQECGDCPGCRRAYDLNGDPFADWEPDAEPEEPVTKKWRAEPETTDPFSGEPGR